MTKENFLNRVDSLLSAKPTAQFLAQVALAEKVLGGGVTPVLLFGAGGLGRQTLTGLRAMGVPVGAFVDSNPAMVGRIVDGVPVMSLAEAGEVLGVDAVIVITIWRAFATETMQDRIAALRLEGWTRVLPFYYLFWQKPSTFGSLYSVAHPDGARSAAAAVGSAAALFEDHRSQEEFLAQLGWRLDPEATALQILDDAAIYFCEALYRPIDSEVYVDCGGFDGDTLKDFYRAAHGRFAKAVVFEPDPKNFAALNSTVASLPGSPPPVQTFPFALGSQAGILVFDSIGSVSSQISSTGTIKVRCERLDDVLAGERVTFIKMDIEGAEVDAIKGAEALIKANRPILTICLYHRQDHMWQIPLQIASLVANYDYHLRTYGKDGWDLVLYAIPRERRKPAPVSPTT